MKLRTSKLITQCCSKYQDILKIWCFAALPIAVLSYFEESSILNISLTGLDFMACRDDGRIPMEIIV